MADIKVLHISHCEPDNFTCSQPKRNFKGGLRIDIGYACESMRADTYLIQTPKLRAPFGLGMHENEGNTSYSLSMSLDEYQTAGSVHKEFMEGIQAIDEKITKLAAENSVQWFKKPMKLEVIQELFRPSIKMNPNGEWPPTFKLKVPYYNNKMNCRFYNAHKQQIEGSAITKGSQCISLVQLSHLWFLDRQFGCTWVTKQVQVFPLIRFDSFMIDDDMADNNKEDCAMRD